VRDLGIHPNPLLFFHPGPGQGKDGSRESVKAYLVGLPASVNNYYATRASLENTIASLRTTPIVITATSNGYGRATAGVSHRAAREALADAKELKAEKVKYLTEQLTDLKKSGLQFTTITAYPTGLKDNGIPRWQAVQ
jgi:hypothetical protein